MDYKSEYQLAMDRKGIKYTVVDERCLRLSYRGENTSNIVINVIFDKNNKGYVSMHCWSFGKVPESKRIPLLELCNSLNDTYKWTRFYITKANEILVSLDAIVEIKTVGEECIELVSRMVDIYDKAYPQLMKACWS